MMLRGIVCVRVHVVWSHFGDLHGEVTTLVPTTKSERKEQQYAPSVHCGARNWDRVEQSRYAS